MFVIRCVEGDGDIEGQYLTDFDPDYSNGIGLTRWTTNRDKAWVYPTKETAIDVVLTQSTVRPLHDDGKPNRPLTAFHVVIEQIPNPNHPDFWKGR